tara:strand:+ start:1933 stop:2565 length:633 start_codon:yes stop_codon:yes gene_type:complete
MTDQSEPDFAALPFSHPFRVAALPTRKPRRFDLKPDAAMRREIAAFLDILAIKALTFRGTLAASGRHDYVLEAELVAVVEQACSITLAPVRTEIRETVLRRFIADFEVPEGNEAEMMAEDDTDEPLGEVIDAGHLAVEALTLALPIYPRAPGAVLGEAGFTAPGTEPLRDADLRPFAGLAGLKATLEDALNSGNKAASESSTDPKITDGS